MGDIPRSEDVIGWLPDSVPKGVLKCRPDGSEIIEVNDLLCQWLGFDRSSDLLGKPLAMLWPDTGTLDLLVKLLQRQSFVSGIKTGLKTGDNAVRDFTAFCNYKRQASYFEIILLNNDDLLSYRLMLAEQGQTLDNLNDSVIILNMSQNRLLYANLQAHALFPFLSADASGDDIFKRLLPLSREEMEHVYHCIGDNRSWHGDCVLTLGREKRFLHHKIQPHYESGDTKTVVIVSSDVTELVRTREQAEAASIVKSQFLANINHEIRTPMIGILGLVDLLEQGNLNPEQVESVDLIRDCGKQLLDIINELLEVAKIELNDIVIAHEPLHIPALINGILALIEPLALDKGLKIKIEIAEDFSVSIISDATRLKQIILNLLNNAVKFTPGGEIKLKATLNRSDDNDFLQVSVCDSGIGISPQEAELIFDRFTQLDSSAAREYSGTGVGLFICRKLIESMGGSIWYTPSPQGPGSIFSFRVPIEIYQNDSRQNNEEAPIPAGASDRLFDFRPVHLLVVEDNELNRMIIQQMLENNGFDVTTANNGLECLKILPEKKFDLILMDMQMPLMDGYETTSHIRQNTELKNIPVIAVTAHAMAGDREKCLACGCDSYIAKPFRAEDLIAEINNNLHTDWNPPRKGAYSPQQLINDLMPEFLATLEESVTLLYQAVQKKDLKEVQSISHDIKGTAGLYGFMNISATAADLEKAARENQHEHLLSYCQQLAGFLQQVSIRVS